MKLCIDCNNIVEKSNWFCVNCDKKPEISNGCIIFSPDFANKNNEFFNEKNFQFLMDHEDANFWFRSRNKLIIWAIKKYFKSIKNYFELGCGTGFVISNIAKEFPELDICGADIYTTSLPYAKNRTSENAVFFQMDGRNIPFKEEFDLIGAFDVLEHIKEDVTVIRQLHKALKNGGGLILTVPQHPKMWSAADDFSCHVRRYKRTELQSKLLDNGFEIILSTSFVSLLLPLMFLCRSTSNKNYDFRNEFKLSKACNKILEKMIDFDIALIKMGLSLPCGGSRLVLAKKIEK